MSVAQKCKVEGCDNTGMLDSNGKRYLLKGLCSKHYQRLRFYGDPNFTKYEVDGLSRHYLYHTWAGMIQRCHNVNNAGYYKYGAKGVTVCGRWRKNFKYFLEDMGDRPDGTTLDRINPYGNYEPGNCRWADAITQANNKRKTTKKVVS